MCNLKELFYAKRRYFEAERIYGENIYNFIRSEYFRLNNIELPKSIGARVEFKEIGKYGKPELVVSGRADILTGGIINALMEEFNLKVYYKCISTGVNESSGEIIQKTRVYFGHNWTFDELKSDEEVVDKVNGIKIIYNQGDVMG